MTFEELRTRLTAWQDRIEIYQDEDYIEPRKVVALLETTKKELKEIEKCLNDAQAHSTL